MIADPDKDESDKAAYGSVDAEWIPLWKEALGEELASRQLADTDFIGAEAVWKCLSNLCHDPQVRAMQRLDWEHLDASVPRLLVMTVENPQPDLVLERVLPPVEAVARCSTYLVLSTEDPGALGCLLTLCVASPMIAEQITRFPILLDELPNKGCLFCPLQAVELAAELRERLMRIPGDNPEQQMETLHHFKLAHGLRMVASETVGTLSLMRVDDYLTWLAEAIPVEVLELA